MDVMPIRLGYCADSVEPRRSETGCITVDYAQSRLHPQREPGPRRTGPVGAHAARKALQMIRP
jgi:hypothetical protein